jgi:hypothetical protein
MTQSLVSYNFLQKREAMTPWEKNKKNKKTTTPTMIKEYVQRTQNQLKQILMTQAGKI